MTPDVSIIVVNYNTPELTEACVRSVINTVKKYSYEIIVVDNSSTKPARDLRQKFQTVKLLENPANPGFGSANNLGMQTACGKVFLLLNSDAMVAENCIDDCVSFLESEEAERLNIGMIGCRLLNSDGTLQPSVFPYLRNDLVTYFCSTNPIANRVTTWLKTNKHLSFDFDSVQEVGDISGAFMLLKKEVFEKTGGFDPDFFMYCEDTEWCRERVRKSFSIYYYPPSACIHLGGGTTKGTMSAQQHLSLALVWYKKGVFSYFGFLLADLLNMMTLAVIYVFLQKKSQKLARASWSNYARLFPQLFLDIPKHPRSFGARKRPLILRK